MLNFEKKFLGGAASVFAPAIRKHTPLTHPASFGSDVSPVGRRAKLFAAHSAAGFALDIDSQLGKAFAVAIGNLPEVPDRRIATLGEALLLSDGQAIQVIE